MPEWDAEMYARYRPTYPPTLYQSIIAYGGPEFATDLAIDIGCGTGQVTASLAERFTNVIGIDASESQLSAAAKRPNIKYVVGSAEATGLDGSCADMVTAAAALHWFDSHAFFSEARRILKPNGVLAAWSYSSVPQFPGNTVEAETVYLKMRDVLWPYFDPRLHKAINEGYAHFVTEARKVFEESTIQEIVMDWPISVEGLVGWVRSWSPYLAYCRAQGDEEGESLLNTYRDEMQEALGVKEVTEHVTVRLRLQVVLARGFAGKKGIL